MYEDRGHISALGLYIHGVDACLLANRKQLCWGVHPSQTPFHNHGGRDDTRMVGRYGAEVGGGSGGWDDRGVAGKHVEL